MGVEGKQTNENRKEKQDEGKVHNGEGLGASIYSLIKVLPELCYSHIKVFGCVAVMR
jgi:hypothetical protein